MGFVRAAWLPPQEAHGLGRLAPKGYPATAEGEGSRPSSRALPRTPADFAPPTPAGTFPPDETPRDAGSTETRLSTGSRARDVRARRGAPLPPRDGRRREGREFRSRRGGEGEPTGLSAPQRASPAT